MVGPFRLAVGNGIIELSKGLKLPSPVNPLSPGGDRLGGAAAIVGVKMGVVLCGVVLCGVVFPPLPGPLLVAGATGGLNRFKPATLGPLENGSNGSELEICDFGGFAESGLIL